MSSSQIRPTYPLRTLTSQARARNQQRRTRSGRSSSSGSNPYTAASGAMLGAARLARAGPAAGGLALRRAALPQLALRRPMSTAAAPAALCAEAIGSAPVVVFSRSWCPFCKQLEAVFGQAIAKDLQPHVTFGARPSASSRSSAACRARPAQVLAPHSSAHRARLLGCRS